MATGKVLGGNWSFPQSFTSYFLCCYEKNETKDGRDSPEFKQFDNDSETQNKGVDNHAADKTDDSNLIDSSSKGYGSVQSLKSNRSNTSKKQSNKARERQKKKGKPNDEIFSIESGHRSSVTSTDTGVGTLSYVDLVESGYSDGSRSKTGTPVKSDRKNKKGNAYNYDDQDTSSDSDDEVLRHYQQSVRHSGSTHSLRGKNSTQSSQQGDQADQNVKDDSHSKHKKDKLLSLAEKGGKDSSAYSSGEESGGDQPKPHQTKHLDPKQSKVDPALTPGATPTHEGGYVPLHDNASEDEGNQGGASTSPTSSDQRRETTFDNQAFLTEEQASIPGTHSAQSLPVSSKGSTEREMSQFGADTASVSVGEMDKDKPQVECSIMSEREAPDGEDSSTVLPLQPGGSKEHLFDVSDLQDREPVLISKCGNLEVTFDYDSGNHRMRVTVHQAKEIPTKDRGGSNHNQVRLLLLPSKKVKHKTKIKTGDNPVYDETFSFKVPEEDAEHMGVRFRLYGCERMRRERMIGESIVGFASINLDTPTTHMLTLEPRSNLSHGDSKMDVSSISRSDSASSTQSMQHGGMPELLIGLAYNGTTGRLSVEVIKGSNFRNMAMNRAPDTYVKLTLMSPNGQEIARSKTSIRRGQPHPLFKETFMFQVALFQLPDVTLMVSVYNKRSMKRKEMIGWFSEGYNNSGDEELAHWNDMRESKGEQVCRWHVLLEA